MSVQTVALYQGRLLTELSREELIEAVEHLGHLYNEALEREITRAREVVNRLSRKS